MQLRGHEIIDDRRRFGTGGYCYLRVILNDIFVPLPFFSYWTFPLVDVMKPPDDTYKTNQAAPSLITLKFGVLTIRFHDPSSRWK